jgi:hypothetical protein
MNLVNKLIYVVGSFYLIDLLILRPKPAATTTAVEETKGPAAPHPPPVKQRMDEIPTPTPPDSLPPPKPTPAAPDVKDTIIDHEAEYQVMVKEFHRTFPVEVGKPETDWSKVKCKYYVPGCDLKNTTYGHPFLMMSFGRAGTTSTWDIVAGLTGEYIPRATEDMGRDKGEGRAFMAAQDQDEHGKCWLERLLCTKQKEAKRAFKKGLGKSSIFGAKWKPWHQGFNTTVSREALHWLGANPNVKILHNKRNHLDMFISKMKHSLNPEETAHCRVDENGEADQACVQKWKDIEANMALPIPNLFQYLGRVSFQSDFVVDMLKYYEIDHVSVTYETLYFSKTAEEWMRIFRYFGFGPTQNLTLEEVFASTQFASTSVKDRSKRMSNYDEVVAALTGTRYEEFLT